MEESGVWDEDGDDGDMMSWTETGSNIDSASAIENHVGHFSVQHSCVYDDLHRKEK